MLFNRAVIGAAVAMGRTLPEEPVEKAMAQVKAHPKRTKTGVSQVKAHTRRTKGGKAGGGEREIEADKAKAAAEKKPEATSKEQAEKEPWEIAARDLEFGAWSNEKQEWSDPERAKKVAATYARLNTAMVGKGPKVGDTLELDPLDGHGPREARIIKVEQSREGIDSPAKIDMFWADFSESRHHLPETRAGRARKHGPYNLGNLVRMGYKIPKTEASKSLRFTLGGAWNLSTGAAVALSRTDPRYLSKGCGGAKKSAIRDEDLFKGPLTAEKAKKILEDGEVNGQPLTAKQKRFFGAVAGGQAPKK